MAHMIEGNKALFVGQPAWHGLGKVFAVAPDVDTCLRESGLDTTIDLVPVYTADGRQVPGQRAVVRNDGTIYTCVGDDYTVYQNAAMFDWFRPVIESGEASIEACGSLNGGRRVWCLAAVKNATAEIVKGDTVKHYILMAHGHDGSLSIKAGFTSVRVVCQNTLSAALGRKSSKLLSVRHTKNARLTLDKIREAFDIERGELQSQASVFQYLATKKCDDKVMTRFAREVLSPGNGDTESVVRNVQLPIDNFKGAGQGSDIPGVRGTMWGAFNAVTEYLTHEAGRSADTRVNSGWFGSNRKMTERALEVAVAFADVAPDATSLGRECYQNSATAQADFGALLGKPVRATFDSAAE